MSNSQIRLSRTPEVDNVLMFLRSQYSLLSESEIIKMALSEKYQKEQEEKEKKLHINMAWNELKSEGKKLGDSLLKKKNIKRKNISEEQFHNLILAPKK
jgi:hypothetical protein